MPYHEFVPGYYRETLRTDFAFNGEVWAAGFSGFDIRLKVVGGTGAAPDISKGDVEREFARIDFTFDLKTATINPTTIEAFDRNGGSLGSATWNGEASFSLTLVPNGLSFEKVTFSGAPITNAIFSIETMDLISAGGADEEIQPPDWWTSLVGAVTHTALILVPGAAAAALKVTNAAIHDTSNGATFEQSTGDHNIDFTSWSITRALFALDSWWFGSNGERPVFSANGPTNNTLPYGSKVIAYEFAVQEIKEVRLRYKAVAHSKTGQNTPVAGLAIDVRVNWHGGSIIANPVINEGAAIVGSAVTTTVQQTNAATGTVQYDWNYVDFVVPVSAVCEAISIEAQVNPASDPSHIQDMVATLMGVDIIPA